MECSVPALISQAADSWLTSFLHFNRRNMKNLLVQFFFTELLSEFHWDGSGVQKLVLVADSNLLCFLKAYNKIEFLGKVSQNDQGWVCNTEIV